MQFRFLAIALSRFRFVLVPLTVAQDSSNKTKPVRMGCGIMTFDTVPGWGLRPDGSSTLGPDSRCRDRRLGR